MLQQADLFAPAPRVLTPGDFEIRVLSLWRPWAHSMHGWVELRDGQPVFHPGPKDIENRGWHPPEALVGRCFLALQSGLTFDAGGAAFLAERGWHYPGPHPKGCITGLSFLERQFGRCDRGCARCTDPATDPRGRDRFYMGGVAWVQSGFVPFIEPVPCVGGQGLRKLPPDLDTRVRDEYRRSLTALAGQLMDGPRLAA